MCNCKLHTNVRILRFCTSEGRAMAHQKRVFLMTRTSVWRNDHTVVQEMSGSMVPFFWLWRSFIWDKKRMLTFCAQKELLIVLKICDCPCHLIFPRWVGVCLGTAPPARGKNC